jgi:hypothetical protein
MALNIFYQKKTQNYFLNYLPCPLRQYSIVVAKLIIISITITFFFLPVLDARSKQTEDSYRKKWCEEQNGQSNIKAANASYYDCVTKSYVIDVTSAKHWYLSIGKILQYSSETNKRAGLVIILETALEHQYWEELTSTIKKYDLPIDVWSIGPAKIKISEKPHFVGKKKSTKSEQDSNSFASNLESYFTVLAIIIGGIWTYMLFIKNRQKYPKAELSLEINQISLSSNKILIHASLRIKNLGNVILQLECGFIRLQQIKPLNSTIKNSLQSGEDPAMEETKEFPWPLIEERNWK